MKKIFIILTLVTVTLSQAYAQQRRDMPELGLSVTLPADWSDVSTQQLTDKLPAAGFVYFLNRENGQMIAVHHEDCSSDERKQQWESGEIPKRMMDGKGTITPIPEDSPVRFGNHEGFQLTTRDPKMPQMAYVFYWVEGQRCYKTDLVAPQEVFERSAPVFQQLIESISITE